MQYNYPRMDTRHVSARDAIGDAISLGKALLDDGEFLSRLDKAISAIGKCFAAGKKLLIAGNGGSAADAQHFAAELMGTFRREARRAFPAIALTTDASFLTAWPNDFGFETVFSRQVEGLGERGDIFFGISTSGNSENVIRGARAAKDKGMTVVSLLGNDGGKLKEVADIALIVPSNVTARIQEAHILTIHIICEALTQNA